MHGRVEAAKLETDEIIGALVQYMRFDLADLFSSRPIAPAGEAAGISHNIKMYHAVIWKLQIVPKLFMKMIDCHYNTMPSS